MGPVGVSYALGWGGPPPGAGEAKACAVDLIGRPAHESSPVRRPAPRGSAGRHEWVLVAYAAVWSRDGVS